MELGRECLDLWGYKRVDELIWVKTNQLQRLIRTGRTGHWLNHSKEHCLVGIKGNPQIHRRIDCDVLVAEVRRWRWVAEQCRQAVPWHGVAVGCCWQLLGQGPGWGGGSKRAAADWCAVRLP